MTDKIHENWVKPTVPVWEEIKPPQVYGTAKELVHSLRHGYPSPLRIEAADVIEKQAAEIDRLTKQCNDFAQEAFKTRIESETLEQHYKCEIDRLRTLITKLHAAKVRFHTQLAACDLFDAIGLKNERPVK